MSEPDHPCYVGGGEYDHDMKFVDESFSHEFGTEICGHWECLVCGFEEDYEEAPPYDDWTDFL